MFIAAPNIQSTRFAHVGLLFLCIGTVAGPAWGQNQDVFGPPAVPPITVEPVTAPPIVVAPIAVSPIAVAPVSATPVVVDGTGVEALGTRLDPTSTQKNPTPSEANPQKAPTPAQSFSRSDSRLLGGASQLSRPITLITGETQPDTSPIGGMGRTAWATALVLALIMIVAMVVRAVARRQGGLRAALGAGGRAPGGLLEVLGRFPVGRGQTLVLLKLDQRVLLLSQSSGGRLGAGAGMNTLCEITDPEEVASILIKSRGESGDSMADRFRSMLAGHSSAASLPRSTAAGRAVFENDAGDSTELWDETEAINAITEQADEWPVGLDSSSLGSLRSRLEHWRDVEATS